MPMILKLPLFFLRNFLIITQYQEPSKSILLPPPPSVSPCNSLAFVCGHISLF